MIDKNMETPSSLKCRPQKNLKGSLAKMKESKPKFNYVATNSLCEK